MDGSQQKKPKTYQTQACRTCFINHLPPSTTISTLSQIFRKHGAIDEITIPAFQKNPNTKFAFIQYRYPQSLVTALRDENGCLINGSKVTVLPAKYDKPIQTHILPTNNHPKTPTSQKPYNTFKPLQTKQPREITGHTKK